MKYIDKLVSFSSEERSTRFKALTLAGGITMVLVVFASLVLWISRWLVNVFTTVFVEPLPVLGGIIALLGLAVVGWTALTMWMQAQGTPAPVAPTRKLITSGPFKYCRNPMQLGVMVYLLGLGAALFSLVTGLVALLLAFIVGGIYHRFVEEKELEARFGHEYQEYRRTTPFLLPCCTGFWKGGSPHGADSNAVDQGASN